MNEYSLRELECFLAVAEELSFTRAAERIRLAQPPLSRHVKNLEEKLGVVLFERSRRQVSLTPAGRAFLDNAGDILIQLRQAGEAAKRAAQGETDRLAVGFVSAVLSPELVDVFAAFRRTCPEVRLHLRDLLPSQQIAALAGGELDIAFVGVEPEKAPAGLCFRSWREEALHAFVPPDHALAGRAELTLEDLAEEAFVLISAEAAPSFASHLHRLCAASGYRPRVVQEASRAQAVAAMTVAGAGVSILPASLHGITGNGIPLRAGSGRGGRGASRGLFIRHVIGHRAESSAVAGKFLHALSSIG